MHTACSGCVKPGASPLIPPGVRARDNGGSLNVFTADSFCAGHRQKFLPVVMFCQAEKHVYLCAHPVLQGRPAASSRQGRTWTVLHPSDTAFAQQQLPARPSWAVAVLGTVASAS